MFALMGLVLMTPAFASYTGPWTAGTCSGALYCNDGSPGQTGNNINGNTDAWTINFGYWVSDSFVLGAGGTITGVDFAVWEFPGDSMTSVDWAIGTAFGDNSLGSGTAATTDTFLGTNSYGYNIDEITFSFAGISLGAGTYYLTLQNAVVPSGDPVYWDENSGPSSAAESAVGTIPSEAFGIDGTNNKVPEPGAVVLFGSALLLLGGTLRRRLLNR